MAAGYLKICESRSCGAFFTVPYASIKRNRLSRFHVRCVDQGFPFTQSCPEILSTQGRKHGSPRLIWGTHLSESPALPHPSPELRSHRGGLPAHRVHRLAWRSAASRPEQLSEITFAPALQKGQEGHLSRVLFSLIIRGYNFPKGHVAVPSLGRAAPCPH